MYVCAYVCVYGTSGSERVPRYTPYFFLLLAFEPAALRPLLYASITGTSPLWVASISGVRPWRSTASHWNPGVAARSRAARTAASGSTGSTGLQCISRRGMTCSTDPDPSRPRAFSFMLVRPGVIACLRSICKISRRRSFVAALARWRGRRTQIAVRASAMTLRPGVSAESHDTPPSWDARKSTTSYFP